MCRPYGVNPIHAESILENISTYLHFTPFLSTEIMQEVENLPGEKLV